MERLFQNGVSDNSTIFFHTPTSQIPNFLYYPVCIGHYYCDTSYNVNRSSYDSFLLLYVVKGQIQVEAGGTCCQVSPGEVCLLDCFAPHCYFALELTELKWIHFDGGSSRSYFNYLSKDAPFYMTALKNPVEFEETWQRLYEALLKKQSFHEMLISQDISQLLTETAVSGETKKSQEKTPDFLDIILKYIHRHLDSTLTLNDLADRASLSPFYFSRRFKEKTGYTPYQYILTSRINLAKFYLKSTSDTVKTVGYGCGFQSEHSFCTAFKKETGMTPSQYRRDARSF